MIVQKHEIFDEVDSNLFPRPLVVQDRNHHSNEADFEAEITLYTQTSALLGFLEQWTNAKSMMAQAGCSLFEITFNHNFSLIYSSPTSVYTSQPVVQRVS